MGNQRGEGRLGVFVWVVLLGLGIFIAAKTIPTRIAVLELHDFCEEQTRYAAASGSKIGAEQLKRDILQKASQLEIPLDPKQVVYEKRKNVVIVQLKHDVTIDLSFYEWVWEFDKKFENVRY